MELLERCVKIRGRKKCVTHGALFPVGRPYCGRVAAALSTQYGVSGFVTLHVQRDGRITLGTAVHWFEDCHAIRGREVHQIAGGITVHLPTCFHCNRRIDHGKG